jgi:hypothetical protein
MTSSSGIRDRRVARARFSSPIGRRCTRTTRASRTWRFYEQAQAFKALLATAAPDAEQQKDLDFLLNVGHLFSLIVYGQLILEQAALTGLDGDLIDAIFDFQVRDFSAYAVALHGKPSSTPAQQEWAASRLPTPTASTGSGNGSRPTTVHTKCDPEATWAA